VVKAGEKITGKAFLENSEIFLDVDNESDVTDLMKKLRY